MLGGFLDGPEHGIGQLAGWRRSRAMPELTLLRIGDWVTMTESQDVFFVVDGRILDLVSLESVKLYRGLKV
jgi:hypothetical protein